MPKSCDWSDGGMRLARDYERLTESSEAMIQVAAIQLILKHLKLA